MPISPSSISSAAGAAASNKVNKEVLGKCLTDKEGNIYTVGSRFFRLLTIFFDVIIAICIVGIIVLGLIDSKMNLFGDDSTSLIVLIIGILTFIMLNLVYHYGLKCKYTLRPEGLKIEKASLNATIPYSELKEWMLKYPPVEYRFCYGVILKNVMIRYNFTYMIGSLSFIVALCQRADIPIPDIARLQNKIMSGFAGRSKEEKLAFKKMKQAAKQLKR